MEPSQQLAIVCDLGGSRLRVGVAGPNGIVESQTATTPLDPDEFFNTLSGFLVHYINQYKADMPSPVLGIGMPGPVRRSQGQTMVGPMSKIPGFELPVHLPSRLGMADGRLKGLGVYVLNDATAAAYEAAQLPGLRAENNEHPVTYITHSTGIGGDTVLRGKELGLISEYGKIPMYHEGRYVMLEDLISGDGIKALYGDGKRDAKEIGMDPMSQGVWDTIGRDFGRGLAILVPALGMSDIVIGGGISRDHDRYHRALMSELDTALAVLPPDFIEMPRITYVPDDEIDNIGLLGAYRAIQLHGKELEYV